MVPGVCWVVALLPSEFQGERLAVPKSRVTEVCIPGVQDLASRNPLFHLGCHVLAPRALERLLVRSPVPCTSNAAAR